MTRDGNRREHLARPASDWPELSTKWATTRAVKLLVGLSGLFLVIAGAVVLSSRSADDLLLAVISTIKRKPPNSYWLPHLRLVAADVMFFGTGLVLVAWLAIPRWHSLVSAVQRRRFALIAAVIVLATLWLPIVLFGHSATFGGARYWWLCDDAMISMRYARNFADGFGLVWNPGERVEGYTNFLWVVCMALVHMLPLSASKTSLVVLFANIALSIAILPVIARLVDTIDGGKAVVAASLAAFVLNYDLVSWATSGLETLLLTLLVLLAVERVIRESQIGDCANISTFLLTGAVSLVRADALVLSFLLYGLAFLLAKNRQTALFYGAISFLLPVMYWLFRFNYYGDLLPNTAYVKTMNWDGKLVAGFKYFIRFGFHYALVIGLAVLGAIRSNQRSQRLLLMGVAIYAAYVVYVGGDTFEGFRFFVPVLPLLIVLAFAGLDSFGLRRSVRFAVLMLCFVTSPSVALNYATSLTPAPFDVGNVRIGLLLKQNTPATAKVADFWAGSVFYFSERYAIDLLGKSDRYVAHLSAVSDGMVPGHNKFDFNYSLGVLKPDLVVAPFKLPVREDEMRDLASGDWAYAGRLYANPIFRQHCLPYPVTADTWRTIFACDWSDLAQHRGSWQNLAL